MKNYTKEEYEKLTKSAVPKSPVFKNCLMAFWVGGLICTIGQVFFKLYMMWGFSISEARTMVSITLILISATLTACVIYEKIGKHAGAGTLVPITGFANSMVSPAMEFKSEGIVTGLCVKFFSVAGPVIVFSTTASVIYGLIVYFWGM